MSFFQHFIDIFSNSNKNILINIAIILIAFFIGKILGSLIAQNNFKKQIKEGRADAIKRSRAVLGGQMIEQVAPFLPNFPTNPADVRFIGKPIDFIAFPGTAEGKPVEEIFFIEVKTGASQLSEREKEIKAAVEKGKIRYIEYRIKD